MPSSWASRSARRSWPAISRSPTTMESRPAPTSKRCCRAAASSRRVMGTNPAVVPSDSRTMSATSWVEPSAST